MSSTNDIKFIRRWLYERIDHTNNQVSEGFYQGQQNFIQFAKNQELFMESGKLFCPCSKCENGKLLQEEVVSKHLYNRGFMPNYWVWISHRKDYDILNNFSEVPDGFIDTGHEDPLQAETDTEPVNPYVAMASDAFPHMEEEPNVEAKRFYDILDAAKHPIYNGCKEGLSQLSLASRLMSLKTDYNLPQNCMDSSSQMMQDYLPEGNNSMNSYYDIKKLMRLLGLPYHKIDVCQDNCMLFWKDDAKEEMCKFCRKDRFRPIQKPGQKKIAYQQMFYLPIADRLQRLLQSGKPQKI